MRWAKLKQAISAPSDRQMAHRLSSASHQHQCQGGQREPEAGDHAMTEGFGGLGHPDCAVG